MPRRTYTIRKFYAVLCSQCGEDIADEGPETKAEAEKIRRIHEGWHKRHDAERAAILKASSRGKA